MCGEDPGFDPLRGYRRRRSRALQDMRRDRCRGRPARRPGGCRRSSVAGVLPLTRATRGLLDRSLSPRSGDTDRVTHSRIGRVEPSL